MRALTIGRAERIAARHFWALSCWATREGDYILARRYSRLAGELLGVELAAPVSVAMGGVR